MTRNRQHDICKQLCDTLGIEAILEALPQRIVKDSLGLVLIKELAAQLNVPYETLRSRILSRQMPCPEMRLRRRAYFTREQAEQINRESDGG